MKSSLVGEVFFSWGDWLFKKVDKLKIRPLRKRAIRQATEWMTERFANSDGLGAIFPPIVWSVVALKCLGHDDDSPLMQSAMNELDKLMIDDGETIRLQPCKSPVWDTALTTIALRDAGVPRDNSRHSSSGAVDALERSASQGRLGRT